MRQISFNPVFEDWQKEARQLLRENLAPTDVLWEERGSEQSALELCPPAIQPGTGSAQKDFRVPPRFLELSRLASLHRNSCKWGLLYRLLWRLTHGEPRVLEVPADADTIQLEALCKQVQKDAYRMRAFVRFRETRLMDYPWFVAWYEPEHQTLELNGEFFRNRFTGMRWSVLTPARCMHWDGATLSFSPGVTRSEAPDRDHLEELWITYYSKVFNPARLNPLAMQAQLPRRNWKNLPEAKVIAPLLQAAPRRTAAMLQASDFTRPRSDDFSIARPPTGSSLEGLKHTAASCRACPLWKAASCTVFGEGPSDARIVLVGEQPGDQEDRVGKPFVGPAGQLLDQALSEAGIFRKRLYVTNAVKHFKFEQRGKRRMHDTPKPPEIRACKPWLEAELNQIKPELIVALGATAAHALFGEPIRIGEHRGRCFESEYGPVFVTIHPSALLRLPDKTTFAPEYQRFVAELRLMVETRPSPLLLHRPTPFR